MLHILRYVINAFSKDLFRIIPKEKCIIGRHIFHLELDFCKAIDLALIAPSCQGSRLASQSS